LGQWTIDAENTDKVYISAGAGNPSPSLRHDPDSSQTKNSYFDTRLITNDYRMLDGIIEYEVYLAGTRRIIHQLGWRVQSLNFENGYCWRLQTATADGGHLRFTGIASWSTFGTAFNYVSPNTWHSVKEVVLGSTYTGYVNGGSAYSGTDSTKPTEDYLVSHVHGVSLDAGSYALVDNIRVRQYASPEPTASVGTEETNSDPTVDSVTIYESNRVTTVTALTPQTEYAVKVTVTDANTLDDLNTVEVTIFYDSDGDDDPADVPSSGDTQDAAILTCTVGAVPAWDIDPSASTTWSILSGNCTQPALTSSTGDFWFHFIPGKVATEALDWDAYGEADDGGGTPGTLYDGSDYDMDWYGEIAVNTASVDWGSVAPGADFGASTMETGIEVTYIANGAYDENVSVSNPWTGVSGNTTLEETGSPAANQFSLRADDTAVLGSSVLVEQSPSYVNIDGTGTQTGESGDNVTSNTLWLKLGTPFVTDTYNGTIYYQIADGS
jgi:hypothetical protein